jgi:hypothetical protein
MSYVYFVLDRTSNAIKIGKANDIEIRMSDLQVGNPNPLELIHHIKCSSSKHSILLEGQLHSKYEELHLRGEWFRYDEEVFQELITEGTDIKLREKRPPLVVSTLWGDKELFGPKNSPKCYFYNHLTAQILTNYEDAKDMKIPFRTMDYPTHGKPLLMHYSNKLNKVFISTKKHQENIEMNQFNKFNKKF